MKDTLIKLLGLKADASDEDITNAAATFQADMVAYKADCDEKVSNSAQAVKDAEAAKVAAETAKLAAEEKAGKLENTIKTMAEELVNADLETFKDRITNKDEIKAALLNNRAATIAVLRNTKAITTTAPAAPLHNSKTAGTPQGSPTGDTKSVDDAAAKRVSNRAREIMKNLNNSFQQAFMMAQAEVAKDDKLVNA